MSRETREIISTGQLQVHSGIDSPTFYSNVCTLVMQPEEAILIFGTKRISDPLAVDTLATVYISLPSLKRLLHILEEQVTQYERNFGEVETELINQLTDDGRNQFFPQPSTEVSL